MVSNALCNCLQVFLTASRNLERNTEEHKRTYDQKLGLCASSRNASEFSHHTMELNLLSCMELFLMVNFQQTNASSRRLLK